MAEEQQQEPHKTEQFRFGLIGFYASCAGVALGAAVAAAGFMWWESVAALVVGSLITAGSTVGCFLSLTAARR